MAEIQTIGKRLEWLLSELNLGIGDFAESIGMDGSQFGKVLSGKLNITLKQIQEITSKHNVRSGWIIDGEMPVFKQKSGASQPPDLHLLTQLKKQGNELAVSLHTFLSSLDVPEEENFDQGSAYQEITQDKTPTADKQ